MNTHTQRPIGSGALAGMQPGVSPAQRAIAQEMQILMRELFVGAAAPLINQITEPEDYRELARRCRIVARAYFEGLGVIQAEKPLDDSSQENT